MSFLSDINKFPKSNLRKVSTETYHLSGKRFIRNAGEQEETEVDPCKIYPDEKGYEEYCRLKDQSNLDVDKNSLSSAFWSRMNGYVVDIVPDYSIDQIIDRLYISGEDPVLDERILASHKITHILNLTSHVKNKFDENFIYKQIKINDLPTVQIDCFFHESFEFINNALNTKDSVVLVHCHAGVSRSSSFVIAYLMQKKIHSTFEEAYQYVKTKRAKIRPNDGFVKQLKQFENKLNF